MNIIHEINIINKKFASDGCKLRIEKRGEKLTIRGSLPSKENKHILKIQRISLGLNADKSGLEEAQKKLQLIILQLEMSQFDWNNWISAIKPSEVKANDDFLKNINKFEKFFFNEQKNEFYLAPEELLGTILTNPISKD